MQKGKKDLARFAVLHKLGLKGISFRQDILLVFLITRSWRGCIGSSAILE